MAKYKLDTPKMQKNDIMLMISTFIVSAMQKYSDTEKNNIP